MEEISKEKLKEMVRYQERINVIISLVNDGHYNDEEMFVIFSMMFAQRLGKISKDEQEAEENARSLKKIMQFCNDE